MLIKVWFEGFALGVVAGKAFESMMCGKLHQLKKCLELFWTYK